MQKRKGFTLVELVVVIAVIAILAGVMIGTFASVINRANESVKMQEMKAAEIEQKANDVIEKMNNSNWLGWEDFENAVVERMTQVYKDNAQSGTSVSADDIKVAVKAALKEYADSHATGNTGLTEEQVKTIVENAIGKINYNGVTESQVKTIINTAVSGVAANQLTAAQVKNIVNTANANNLTASDVSLVIANLGLATTTNINSAVTQITSALSEATAGALSSDDLNEAIINLLPVTYKVASASDLTKALESVNSFSTLEFSKDFGAVTIETDRAVTLTITGVSLENLTVNAPLATIYLSTNAGTVTVTSVADNSFHVTGTVQALEIKQGRVVVEGKVEELTAAPAVNAVVTVAVQPAAVVTSLEVELQKNGTDAHETVAVENSGTVTNTVVSATGTSTVSTNVVVTNSITSTGATAKIIAESANNNKVAVSAVDTQNKVEYISDGNDETAVVTTENVDTTAKLSGTGTSADPYLIRNVDEFKLMAALINATETYDTYKDKFYSVTADLDISDITWTPIGRTSSTPFAGNFNGNSHTILGLNNRASFEYSGEIVYTITNNRAVQLYALFNYVEGSEVKIYDINMKDVSIDSSTNGSGVAAIAAYVATIGTENNIEFENIEVSGKIIGNDNVGGIAGRTLYGSGSGTVTFNRCVNNAALTATRTNNYARAGGISGLVGGDKNMTSTFDKCENYGTIAGLKEGYVGQIIGLKNYSADSGGSESHYTITDCVEKGTVNY